MNIVETLGGWQAIGTFLTGVVLMKLAAWFADWFTGKGAELVQENLADLQDKLNQNAVLSQVTADDAVIDALEQAIPEALAEFPQALKTALADGKLSGDDIKAIATAMWAKAEPQIRGGVSDYLKTSSFKDGKTVAELVIRRWFAKKQLDKAAAGGGK